MDEQNVESSTSEGQIQGVNDVLFNPVLPVPQPLVNMENALQIKYVGFWIRWVASFIDGIVILVIAIPVMVAFFLLSGGSFFTEDGAESSMGFNFLGYMISWGYYILMTDKYQATLGKKAMGIIVVAEDLSKISLGRIILRETVGKIISGIILGIGYIMTAFTSRKRALHDIISGTVVIYKEPTAKASRGTIIGIIIALVLFFILIIGILAAIVLAGLSGARSKAGIAAFKSEVWSLSVESMLACEKEILSQSNPVVTGKYLSERSFTMGTSLTDCGPKGSGEFSFTVDSVGIPEKCTATVTNQGVTFSGC